MNNSKTDAVDANTLAQYAERMAFVAWTRPSNEKIALRSFSRRLHALTKQKAAALSAKQHDPHVKAYFQHLIDNGKLPMQAVCAVMRNLLHAIHGMLKHNQPFDNTRFYDIPLHEN